MHVIVIRWRRVVYGLYTSGSVFIGHEGVVRVVYQNGSHLPEAIAGSHSAAAVESIAMDGQSIGSKVAAVVTHNSDYRYLVEAPGSGWALDARGIRLTVTLRRGRIVLAGERKGSSSHSGEWRGSGVLSGASSLLHLTWALPRSSGTSGQRENTEAVAKLPQPAQPRYHARGARPEDHVITNY